MVEDDRERDAESVVGLEAGPLVAVAHLDRVPDAEKALRRALLLDAGGLQQINERPRAAVHDRYLRTREIHVEIVDPKTRERGHQMLDGSYLRSAAFDGATQTCVREGARLCPNIEQLAQVDATKDDARVRLRGPQGHRDLGAGVEADTGCLDRGLDRPLFQHFVVLWSKRRTSR